MTGPNAICRVSDLPVERCLHCTGGMIHLFGGDARCSDCGTILEAGGEAWQTPAPESAILCPVCREERSASE